MSSIYPTLDDNEVQKTNNAPEKQNAEVMKVPEYKGEPGPQEGRSCRDVIMLILFVISWIGMIIVASLAIQEGNVDRLRYGNDSEGNLCGVINQGGRDLKDAKYQYLFDPTDPYSYRKCVSSCPNTTFDVICPYDVPVPNISSGNLSMIETLQQLNELRTKNCTFTYASFPLMFRCIPDISKLNYTVSDSNKTAIKNTIGMVQKSGNVAEEIFSDVYDSWSTILICTAIAFGLSFVWLYAIQLFARVMVWITLGLVNILSIAFTAYIFSLWSGYKTENAVTAETASVDTANYNEQMLLALSIIMAVITVGIMLLTIALRSRINLAIEIIEETAKALRKMPMIFILPIVKYVLIVGLAAWTIYIWIMLATSGSNVTSKVQVYANSTAGQDFEPNTVFNYLTIYQAFWFFWSYNFLLAIAQCSIAGSVAAWYWTMDKSKMAPRPVMTALWRTIRYHLGSMAFGSLIIAIIQTIRAVLTYMQYQLKRSKENKFAQYLLSCLQCCFLCLERFLKFINKNAYIEIAVYGYSFCEASKVAFTLLVRNAVRVMVVDKVSDFLFFLAKIAITVSTTMIGAAMLQNPIGSEGTSTAGRFWAVPLALIALFSYVIASVFTSVFDMAVQTIFLCFCEDSERNDGSSAKPYYMDDDLKKFVNKSQKEAPKM